MFIECVKNYLVVFRVPSLARRPPDGAEPSVKLLIGPETLEQGVSGRSPDAIGTPLDVREEDVQISQCPGIERRRVVRIHPIEEVSQQHRIVVDAFGTRSRLLGREEMRALPADRLVDSQRQRFAVGGELRAETQDRRVRFDARGERPQRDGASLEAVDEDAELLPMKRSFLAAVSKLDDDAIVADRLDLERALRDRSDQHRTRLESLAGRTQR